MGCSRGGGSRPQCAEGGRRSPEALVENVSRGSCEASLGHSGLQPRCIEAQELARAQAVALAHSEWLCIPAHRQSVQTLDAAGHCGYNRSKQRCHSGMGKNHYPQQYNVLSTCLLHTSGLNSSHLMLRLRSIRGVPIPQGPSGPPARPNSTCSRGEHVLSTTSVLVTSSPRISTALGGLPSASGASSRLSSS